MLGISPVSSFPVSAIPEFPSTGPIPPPNIQVSKVLALDAAYGSPDVVRFYQTRDTSRLLLNETVAVLIDCGTVFDAFAVPEFVFTKPDGVELIVEHPLGSIGRITAYT